MEIIFDFFLKYGLWLTIIAVAGISLLGILKYLTIFKKLNENIRHYIYLAISIGFSLIATAIYLDLIGSFEIKFFLAVAGAIFVLNQTFYNVFKITPVNVIMVKSLDLLKKLFKYIYTNKYNKKDYPKQENKNENNKE